MQQMLPIKKSTKPIKVVSFPCFAISSILNNTFQEMKSHIQILGKAGIEDH